MSDEVRRLIDESWEQLRRELEVIPEERLEQPGAVGEWSVKDLMGHIAVWDDVAAQRAAARASGKQIDRIGWQERNDREHAARAGWTVEQARREMEAAHARVLEAVERHPDFEAEFWEDSTYGHYIEHIGDLRAWRGSW